MKRNNGKNHAVGRVDVSLLDVSGGHINAKPTFPGWEGLPFKGPVPDLKADDPQFKQPQVGTKLHVELLDLSKAKELKQYRDICQAISNGYAQLSKEDMRYDEAKKSWRVFIRWIELFTFDPSKGNSHGYGR